MPLKSLLCFLGLVVLSGCSKGRNAAPNLAVPKQPNVLLFLSDDLSWHDLGCYGNKDINTPNIDQLAADGLRFEYCFNSAPMCAPTRMSLYTGIHPVRNGAHPNHSFVYPDVKSFPHYLEPLGYRVALLGKKHYQPEENFPFEWLGGLSHDSGKDPVDLDISQVDNYINRQADKPWCLVVASNQSHMPWNRGDPTAYNADELTLPPYMVDTPETREAMTHYYAEITYMDHQLGECLAILERSGQADNTLVIYLSEQGSNFPHCKWTCYDSGLRSAALFRLPGVTRAGTTTPAMMQYIDVLPTLIKLAGGDPDPFDFDGKSLLPVLRGERSSHRDYVFGIQTSRGIYSGPEAYGVRTVRDQRYRLVWNVNSDLKFQNTVTRNFAPYLSWGRLADQGDAFARLQFDRYRDRPEYELYDLQNDPYEMKSLAGEPIMASHLDRLKAELTGWMKQQGDLGAQTEWNALERLWASEEDN